MQSRVTHSLLASVHLSVIFFLGSLPPSLVGLSVISLNSLLFAINMEPLVRHLDKNFVKALHFSFVVANVVSLLVLFTLPFSFIRGYTIVASLISFSFNLYCLLG
jgi:hypothetical protein